MLYNRSGRVAALAALGLVGGAAAQVGPAAGAPAEERPLTIDRMYISWPMRAAPVPAERNLRYGPADRQVLDLWVPTAEQRAAAGLGEGAPTPLVVYFHFGSFVSFGKETVPGYFVEEALNRGWAVASANYRYTSEPGVNLPDPMRDGARAIQALRHRAAEFGLDTDRVAAVGASAGAGIALWVGLHDDLADPDAEDPVLRESSRVVFVGAVEGQATYDPREFERLFPDDAERLFAVPDFRTFFEWQPGEPVDEADAEAFRLASPVTHLSADDPPMYMGYAMGPAGLFGNNRVYAVIHDPALGEVLVDAIDARAESGEAMPAYRFDVLRQAPRGTLPGRGGLLDLLAAAFEPADGSATDTTGDEEQVDRPE